MILFSLVESEQIFHEYPALLMFQMSSALPLELNLILGLITDSLLLFSLVLVPLPLGLSLPGLQYRFLFLCVSGSIVKLVQNSLLVELIQSVLHPL